LLDKQKGRSSRPAFSFALSGKKPSSGPFVAHTRCCKKTKKLIFSFDLPLHTDKLFWWLARRVFFLPDKACWTKGNV
jgi:hypothetical protein